MEFQPIGGVSGRVPTNYFISSFLDEFIYSKSESVSATAYSSANSTSSASEHPPGRTRQSSRSGASQATSWPIHIITNQRLRPLFSAYPLHERLPLGPGRFAHQSTHTPVWAHSQPQLQCSVSQSVKASPPQRQSVDRSRPAVVTQGDPPPGSTPTPRCARP
ncbi:hypothetical protein Bbelb_381780 [Branchiostoma belcheri]|nr:hypothetical protein Bbelb_381780 [Branchiostoma belcheri]